MIARHDEGDLIFSDEKLFKLQEPHNPQNDRVYAASMSEIPANKIGVERFQNVSSVMVWGAISKKGKLPLLFIDKGVKINAAFYLKNVLQDHLLPEAKKLYGDVTWCFQQDSAPAHAAKMVQNWCRENLPSFISSEEWPASSPDLNPLDFCIWGYMLDKMKDLKNVKLDQFREILTRTWNEIPDEVVRAACDEFPKRLRRIHKCSGERIELYCNN